MYCIHYNISYQFCLGGGQASENYSINRRIRKKERKVGIHLPGL